MLEKEIEYAPTCPKCKKEGRINPFEGDPKNPDILHCIYHGDFPLKEIYPDD